MEIDGKQLRRAITRRLEFEGQGHHLYDSIILMRITALTFTELREITNFGYVAKWKREESLTEKEG